MSKRKKGVLIISLVALVVLGIVLLFVLGMKKETYTVTFDSNGGTSVQQQVVEKGKNAKQPKEPTRDGYLFVEWQYNNHLFDFSTEIKQDITLKAKWMEVKEDEKLYTVKFNTDGGNTISNQIIKEGELVKKPKEPTKDGYLFKGWTLNGVDYQFDNPVTENIELVAKWEKEIASESNNSSNNNNSNNNSSNNNNGTTPAKKKYTVSFNSNGGSAVASQTVTEGNNAVQPSNPTRSGYTFAGWTLNGNAYNFNTVVTGNITLVATWNPVVRNRYTVTFDSNGGSAVASQTVEEGQAASQPGSPVRNGYRFNRWLLNGNAYNFGSPVNGNITLVASWTQKSYTITATKVDEYSPDRILTVYEEGTRISVSAIKYSDGVLLCNGSNTTVSFSELAGESSFIVVLTDGTQVTATLN